MIITNVTGNYFLKENDTATEIRLRIEDSKGNALDISTFPRIEVVIGNSQGRLLTKTPVVMSATGELEFGLDEGDRLPVGDNNLEIHMFTDNGERHVAPSKGYYRLRVQKSIDALEVEVTTYTLAYFMSEVNRINATLPGITDTATQALENAQTAIDSANEAILETNIATQNANAATASSNNATAMTLEAVADLQGYNTAISDFNINTSYLKNQNVRFNGSTYKSKVATQGNPLPVAPQLSNEWWDLIAQRGVDGDGSVNSVNGIQPDVNGDVNLDNLNIEWDRVTGKPTTFAPSAHTHAISDVNDLTAQLNAIRASVEANSTKINQRVFNVKFPPNGMTAAVGDNVTDDTPAIQALIDYVSANGGGTVYFPRGIYAINTTIMYKEGVSLVGAKGVFRSTLMWKPSTSGFILDTRNINVSLGTFEGLTFTSTTSKVGSGMVMGSTFANYNAFNARIVDLVFHDLNLGIHGAAIQEAQDPRAIGLFDSYLENVFFSDCNYGFWCGGSGTVLMNPRFAGCLVPLNLDYASPESTSGIHVFGGVFASNRGYDITVTKAAGLRNTSFTGTWFEGSTNGIINIGNPGTYVSVLKFTNCQFNSFDTQFGLFNAANARGVITLDTCVLTQTLVEQDMRIVPPSDLSNGTSLKVTNCLLDAYDRSTKAVNSHAYDPWTAVTLQNGWNQIANLTRYFKTDDNIVHLQFAMSGGTATAGIIIGNLPLGFRPDASVRFSIFDGTNGVDRSLYVDSSGNISIVQKTGETLTTGVWSGYTTFKVL